MFAALNRIQRGVASALIFLLGASATSAQTAPAEQQPPPPAEPSEPEEPTGYTPPETAEPALRFTGYVDVGFAKAEGNGSSFPSGLPSNFGGLPAYFSVLPADYSVDPFAPAVNSRGDVASLDSHGRLLNGFLPSTVNIGGHPSFLINTVSADLRYSPKGLPLFLFARGQLLPRFGSGGSETRVLLQQAFGRITPLESQELAISVGKFDSVFGIEYLENEANLRTGITPSLIARYTTGQMLGLKVLYRYQLPAISSTLSLNAALTNGGTWVDTLQTQNISLTGTPTVSGRLGYEFNQLGLQVKVGVSGTIGPRNDQSDSSAIQKGIGGDARFAFGWLSISGEYVSFRQDEGTQPGKMTGTGAFGFASAFKVDAFYGIAAVAFPIKLSSLQTITVYSRYERRRGEFIGFGPIVTSRVTTGFRLDWWSFLALKAEYLFNRENAYAPSVPNDVFTSSAVFSW